MEKSTPLGFLTGLGLIFGAIFLGNAWSTFFDLAALLLVFGGTAAALLVNYSINELRRLPEGTRGIFAFVPPSPHRLIDRLTDLAGLARREGLLALDRRLDDLEDDLLRSGLEMAVDGMDEEEIAGMLDQRMAEAARRRQLVPKFFTTASTYAPAFGMVGTLIGLIQMLQNLDDPTQIGAGMATALVTTFYGALLANLIFLPLSKKAKAQAHLDTQMEHITLEGVLAIARGDSPRMIERRLSFYKTGAPATEAAPATETAPDLQPARTPAMAT